MAQTLPFYYGWVVLAVSAITSYSSRPVMAVATLSVFVVPMTEHFGWSRGLFSGAVSLGGLCAVAVSPLVGRLIDRFGSGVLIGISSAAVGLCAIGLSIIGQAWAFYALYVPGRMLFASPLELGTSTAVSNWFIRRRPLALALLGATQGTGLAAAPFIAQLIIGGWGWRTAWFSLGIFTLSVGVIPHLMFIVRRPEDIGLEVDPAPSKAEQGATEPGSDPSGPAASREINFTVREALHTRAFWLLATFSAAGFMVQAGVSLHQVPHYISQGLSGPSAALTATTFAFSQVPGGFMWSTLAGRIPVRYLLALAGFAVAIGAAGTAFSGTLGWGLVAAGVLGVGVGGLHLLLSLAWANYYGRQYLGSIRGLTLPLQVGGQALGPIIAGFIFDWTDSYRLAFFFFAIAVAVAGMLVMAGTVPAPPPPATATGAAGLGRS